MLAFATLLLFAQVHGVEFRAAVTPETVYVGQQVSYDATMQANVRAQMSFLAPPQYLPPTVNGATLYDFPFDTLTSIHDVTVSGLTFKAYTYRRALFPLAPGIDTIPPATLVATLPDPDNPYVAIVDSLHSTPQRITVLPLPVAGRPPGFTGAVGQFAVTMQPDSNAVFQVGKTVGLQVTVTGTGNIDLLPRPSLTIPWATVVPTPVEPVHWDSTHGPDVHGSKTFRWLVTPRRGGAQVIPAIQYPYFDPATKHYVTAQAAALPATVTGGTAGLPLSFPGDTLATTPFPTLLRFVQTHLVLILGLVVLIVGGMTVLFVRRYSHADDDHLD
jgi:hypothetical protein